MPLRAVESSECARLSQLTRLPVESFLWRNSLTQLDLGEMKVLVVGSGGREHALAWKLSREPGVEASAAPGNYGIATVAGVVPTRVDDVTHVDAAAQAGIDLTVVGPELPSTSASSITSGTRPAHLGPTRAAARLECSKAFAKEFMSRHGISFARYRQWRVPSRPAGSLHPGTRAPVVVKADGLAAGKGVVVAATAEEANGAIQSMMEDRQFGAAGSRIVLEQCLTGPEVSFFALCDGTRAMPLSSAQDHKRVRRRPRTQHGRDGRLLAEPAGGRGDQRPDHSGSSTRLLPGCAPTVMNTAGSCMPG